MSPLKKSSLSFIYSLSCEDRALLVDKIDKIVATLISVGSLGCRIRPHSSTLDRYPKIRVTSGDCSRTVSLPLCIYALNHPERDDSESIEVSHLCGRSNCCFPLHLTAEPHLLNIQRKRCHRSRGLHRGRCCTHTPKCIL